MNKVKFFLEKYLSNNDNKEVLQHSLLLFIVKVFFTFISFLLSIVIARNLSVDDSGYYFSIVSLIAVLATISRVGLDNTVTRFIAKANAKKDHKKVSLVFSIAFKWSVFSSLVLSLLLAMLGVAYAYYSQQPNNYLILLFIVVIFLPITNVYQILQQSFQGMKKSALFAFFSGLARLLTLLLLLLVMLITETLTLNLALYIFFIATFITVCLALFTWKKQNNHIYAFNDSSDKYSLALKMKKSCITLWGVSCLAIVMSDGVQILVGLLSEPSQAAFFAVAMRIASLVAFILLAINGILSPKFAEISADNDSKRLQDVYRSSARLMLFVTSPIFLIIFIFAEDFLLIFGEHFSQATLVLRILVIAQFFKVIVGSVGQLLIMSGHEKCQRNNLFFSVLLLMLLCVLLIPFYGALGGAIATLCAVVMNNLLGLLQVKRKLKTTLF
jgi:O-antigen/teichoic acid export membrane protein